MASSIGWDMVECKPLRHPSGNFGAYCALIEGDEPGDHHTHWVDRSSGIEVVVAWHKPGERPRPNCQVRRPGVD